MFDGYAIIRSDVKMGHSPSYPKKQHRSILNALAILTAGSLPFQPDIEFPQMREAGRQQADVWLSQRMVT
jgi:hypothetical protein